MKTLLTVLIVLGVLTVSSVSYACDGEEPLIFDLNRITYSELMQLPGITTPQALGIIKRRRVVPYRRTSQILRVPSINRMLYHIIRPYIYITPAMSNGGVLTSSRG